MQKSNVFLKSFLAFGLLGFVTACGVSPEHDSQSKVTNGREVSDSDYPSVVLLYDKTAGAICTGTFVTPTQVLTAAHCTMGGAVSADGSVALSLSIIKISDVVNKKAELVAESVSVARNPLWDKNGKNVNKWDLGVVSFAPGVAKAVSGLSSVRAAAGDKLTIVGYGLNQMANTTDGSSAGVKREGSNKVASLSDGFIQFTGKDKTSNGDGTDSSAGSGDSGGPLFIKGKVAGVTSGGGFGGFGRTQSLYIDIWSPESQAFLSKHLAL